MTHSQFDYQQLYLKAKAFTNRAMDDENAHRSFDEQAMWAALALELLGKAALSRISPLLIADPGDEGGNNLLSAAGVIPPGKLAKTVQASTVWKRCAHAFKPFDSTSASRISGGRNDYLHGSTAWFTSMPSNAWWPKYWALVSILLHGMDKTIADYVGDDRAAVVERHLEQNARNIEDLARTRIERARQRIAQWRQGTLSASVAKQWSPGARNLSNGLSYEELHRCFICGEWGRLEGEDGTYEWDEGVLYVTVDTLAFSCDHCGLELDQHELVIAANEIGSNEIPETFEAESQTEPDFDGYGND